MALWCVRSSCSWAHLRRIRDDRCHKWRDRRHSQNRHYRHHRRRPQPGGLNAGGLRLGISPFHIFRPTDSPQRILHARRKKHTQTPSELTHSPTQFTALCCTVSNSTIKSPIRSPLLSPKKKFIPHLYLFE